MRRYICFYQSIGEKNAVNGMDLLVVVLVVMLVLVVVVMLLGDGVGDIRLSKKS